LKIDMSNSDSFQPNWVSPPGDTINDILVNLEISKASLAERLNKSIHDVNDLLKGNIEITEEIAIKLQDAIGASSTFWLNRENQYREGIIRQREVDGLKWLQKFPIREMTKKGWLKQSESQIKACLDFFNVPDIRTWRENYSLQIAGAAFSISNSFTKDPGSISAWLRQGEVLAEETECKPWDKELFEKKLPELRALIKKRKPNQFLPILKEECAKCGVAVVVVPTLKGCPASGATKFIQSDKAMLLLSFRYRTDDHFWFTFFHEAGHLVLHSEHGLFLEETKNEGKLSIMEQEANDFAGEILIPKELQPELRTVPLRKHDIARFAIKVGVSSGIIIGQMQHIGRIPYGNLNKYKRRYSWDDVTT